MERNDFLDFCREISLPEDAAQVCLQYVCYPEQVQAGYRLLCARPECFFNALRASSCSAQRFLALYTQFAQSLWPVYCQRGISREIYLATFADIVLWEQEYFCATGEHGLGETEWLSSHLRMGLFQLGSLQFQPVDGSVPKEWDGVGISRNELVLNVHIPKGANINSAAVEDSYRRALDFWQVDRAVLLCESWLLEPELSKLLPLDSRIRTFAGGFTLAAVDKTERQAEERIFGRLEEDPSRYPVTSSLSRGARHHLMNGNRLGVGYGWQRIGSNK